MRRDWIKHEAIKPIKSDWKLNKDRYGRYENVDSVPSRGYKTLLNWNIKFKELMKNRKREDWVDESMKLSTLDINKSYFLIWLGHSSFYLYLNGVRVLIDPVFGSVPFVKRITKLPVDKAHFKDIDYILISHDHYDHLNKSSIRTILRQSKHTRILCGAGTEGLLSFSNMKNNTYEVIPMQWYDKYRYNGFKVTFLPSLHWSRRSFSDSRKRLWGAFMIQCGGINLYFSGDTNYGEHFKELPELFDKVDYAIIGIGAFRPRAHAHRNHISPREAIWASKDIGAGVTIPMHYATFDLSKERYAEPLHIFNKAAEINSIDTETPKIGEVLELKSSEDKQ